VLAIKGEKREGGYWRGGNKLLCEDLIYGERPSSTGGSHCKGSPARDVPTGEKGAEERKSERKRAVHSGEARGNGGGSTKLSRGKRRPNGPRRLIRRRRMSGNGKKESQELLPQNGGWLTTCSERGEKAV